MQIRAGPNFVEPVDWHAFNRLCWLMADAPVESIQNTRCCRAVRDWWDVWGSLQYCVIVVRRNVQWMGRLTATTAWFPPKPRRRTQDTRPHRRHSTGQRLRTVTSSLNHGFRVPENTSSRISSWQKPRQVIQRETPSSKSLSLLF